VRTLRALELLEDAGYQLYQPCWRVRSDEGYVVFPDPGHRMPGNDCRLALVPFASEQRFMLAQQMNVFACHRSRVGELKADDFESLAEK